MKGRSFFISLSRHVIASRPLLWFICACIGVLLWFVISEPMGLIEQALFGLITFIFAWIISRFHNRYIGIILILLSITVSCRYMYWRISESFVYESNFQYVLAVGLLLAELYALLTLLLGYFQTIWPLDRLPVRLPADQNAWPSVDIYIPTYNEPLSVVKPCVIAATDLDWPRDKLNIFVLDDGKRSEFARFCTEAGVVHLTRENNEGAKAGNINAAMPRTNGQFITIFDCDHVPSHSFLKVSMGVILADDKMALVQMPHHFFSPDPFERNLDLFRKTPNEGELFYGLTQPGNDFWNAAFFCGSCAVLRRSMLEDVGGVAVETVTEDAHTALKLHAMGYHSAYIGIPQAAGLATESIATHVAQRTRWARGMAQIFRVDNPLIKRGLELGQRLCYFNAMAHFFYGFPRIVFLTAPLGFLYFNVHIISASALMIAVYVIPHLIHAIVTNAAIQGKYRHSFWAEVFETLMAPYLLIPTIKALINPKAGSFNVTAKGGNVREKYLDKRIALPLIIMIIMNLIGMGIGLWDLFAGFRDAETLILNLIWTLYNMMILGAAASVCIEHRQVRDHPRIPVSIQAMIRFENGHTTRSNTLDISESGLSFSLPEGVQCEIGDTLTVSLFSDKKDYPFAGKVMFVGAGRCGILFDEMQLSQYRNLIAVLFGRPNAWIHWADDRIEDRPIQSLLLVMRKAVTGVVGIFRYMWA